MAATRQKSKRPLDTKKDKELRRLLKSVIFFVERSIESKCIVQALRNAGAKIELHSTYYKYKSHTPDVVWLKRMSAKGWVVLMKDKDIAYNPLEYETLLRHNARAFTLHKGFYAAERETEMVLNALPEIIRIIKTYDRPYIAKIYYNSIVRIWRPKGKTATRNWHGLAD